MPSHVLTATGRGWSCLVCGTAFRSHQRAASSKCPGQLPAATAAHSSHNLHAACFQEDEARADLQQLVLCVNCGAHGTARVANLARPCPAAAGRPPEKHEAHRRQASQAARGLHPSRRRVRLLNLRPLRKLPEARLVLTSRGGDCSTQCGFGEHFCSSGAHGGLPDEEGDATLAQLEAMEAEAQCQQHQCVPCEHMDEDEQEDVFGHGDDLGEAAYEPVEVAAATASAELPATAPQQPAGTRRAVAEEPRAAKKARCRVPAVVDASLDGLEKRLQAFGENPRFETVGPGGRQLQHQCVAAAASVNFWPATLLWSVEGPDMAAVEAALLRPLPSDDEESGLCVTPPLPMHASSK